MNFLIPTNFSLLCPRYWGWPLELIWYHFDRVVIWPPRSTFTSGSFGLVWMNIFQIAPKPSKNMQFLSNSDHRWLLQPSFTISPISLFLASGLYLKHFFRIFGHEWAPRYWGWPLELIWYHFDTVVIWPLRSTLACRVSWVSLAVDEPLGTEDGPWNWFDIILTEWSSDLRGQLWPLASFGWSEWISFK